MNLNNASRLPLTDFILIEDDNRRTAAVPPADDLLEDGSLKQFMAFQRQHMKTMENSLKSVVDSNEALTQSVQNLEQTVQNLEQELKKTNKELEQIKKELNLTKALSAQLLQKLGLEEKFQELKDRGLSDDEILQEMAKELDKIPEHRRQNFEEEVHSSIPKSRRWSWKRILLAAGAIVLGVMCPSLIPWLLTVV